MWCAWCHHIVELYSTLFTGSGGCGRNVSDERIRRPSKEKESWYLIEEQNSSFFFSHIFFYIQTRWFNPTRQTERVGGRKMPSYGTPWCRPWYYTRKEWGGNLYVRALRLFIGDVSTLLCLLNHPLFPFFFLESLTSLAFCTTSRAFLL